MLEHDEFPNKSTLCHSDVNKNMYIYAPIF